VWKISSQIVREKMVVEFEMKDLDMMHYFLGLEVWQRRDEIFMNQGKYTVEILKRFRMFDSKEMDAPMVSNMKLLQDMTLETVDVSLYRQMMGLLMNLANIRMDICFVVNTLSQYMEQPG
jgi:hypothetical protein